MVPTVTVTATITGQSNKSVSWHKVTSGDLFTIERLLYSCKD